MTEAASSTAESSLLLWALAFAVAMMSLHVSLGWVRTTQRNPAFKSSWRALLLAACTLGTGLCSAVMLGLSAEALPFALGYRSSTAPLLWLGAVLGSLLPLCWLWRRRNWWALLGSGLLLAALVLALQLGWIAAAGFRPGVRWRQEWVAAAAVLMAVGFGAALWIAFGAVMQTSSKRELWRLSAMALMGLCLIGAQELLMYGGGVLAQVGSVYHAELPSAALSLVCGVLVPLVLLVMATDLAMRKRERRHLRSDRGNPFAPKRRRKRRHRVREL